MSIGTRWLQESPMVHSTLRMGHKHGSGGSSVSVSCNDSNLGLLGPLPGGEIINEEISASMPQHILPLFSMHSFFVERSHPQYTGFCNFYEKRSHYYPGER